MKQAARRGARFAVILGEEELAAGAVTAQDLATGEEERGPAYRGHRAHRSSGEDGHELQDPLVWRRDRGAGGTAR